MKSNLGKITFVSSLFIFYAGLIVVYSKYGIYERILLAQITFVSSVFISDGIPIMAQSNRGIYEWIFLARLLQARNFQKSSKISNLKRPNEPVIMLCLMSLEIDIACIGRFIKNEIIEDCFGIRREKMNLKIFIKKISSHAALLELSF